MKKNLVIQAVATASLMFGGASIASASYYPVTPINRSLCSASSTITIANAKAFSNFAQLSQSQQAALFSPTNLYLYGVPQSSPGFGGALTVGLCLDPGYVSNVPAGIDTSVIFSGADIVSKSGSNIANQGIVAYYSASTSPYVSYPAITTAQTVNGYTYTPNAEFTQGLPSSYILPGTSINSSATSSVTYSVSVNYDKFTAEAKQYGYQSVYTTTGTKTVSVTVFKFNDSSTMTTAQVIAKLAGLGYRPATLSELSAVASQAGNNVVGLGTNLESGYGYPYTGGTGGAGMGHSSGPFGTIMYKFAAVHN